MLLLSGKGKSIGKSKPEKTDCYLMYQTLAISHQYSHIIDENRKDNAKLFENAFYQGQGEDVEEESAVSTKVPDTSADPKVIDELLKNPEVVNLLLKLSKVVK